MKEREKESARAGQRSVGICVPDSNTFLMTHTIRHHYGVQIELHQAF